MDELALFRHGRYRHESRAGVTGLGHRHGADRSSGRAALRVPQNRYEAKRVIQGRAVVGEQSRLLARRFARCARRGSVSNDAADVDPSVHVLITLGNLVEVVLPRDQFVELQIAVAIHLYLPRDVEGRVGGPIQ
jgi:hypothetical protein